MTIQLIVYGSPAPQGSKRFVGMKNGRGMMIESSKKVRPWRQDVKAAAESQRPTAGALDGPLSVRMVFTLPKPTSSPKRRKTYAMKKPDVSKLARSTEDALVDAGLIADDARIVEYTRLAKVFPNEDPDALSAPGVKIEIRLKNESLTFGEFQKLTPLERASRNLTTGFVLTREEQDDLDRTAAKEAP